MNSLPNFWLYQAAFGLQVAAVLLFAAYAAAPKRALSVGAAWALGWAALLQLVFMARLGLAQGGLPLASGFGALGFWSLSLTLLVLWAEGRHKMGLLGAFLAPLSALTLLMGFRFAKADAQPLEGLSNAWMAWHVALAMFSFACFTAAAGVAAAFLVQERQLKRKQMGTLFYKLPALADLEGLESLWVRLGALALGLSLATGFLWRLSLGLSPGLGDPTVLFGVVIWLAYAGAALLRGQSALRGRRFAFLVLAFFLLIFFGYYLVTLYLGGHGSAARP